MSGPAVVGDVGRALLQRMPEHLRDVDLSGVVIPEGETPEDVADRKRRQAVGRHTAWQRRLPRRYATARLSDLEPEQDPDGFIAGWREGGHATLLLHGQASRGKTHAGYGVGADCVEHGLWTVAWTMADLNAAMRPGDEHEQHAFHEVTECDVLLLDDLGREKVTDWTLEALQRVLDHRNRERRRQVITTNLNSEALIGRYGSPIMARLTDDAVILPVKGRARRSPVSW